MKTPMHNTAEGRDSLAAGSVTAASPASSARRQSTFGWWLKLVLQPLLLVMFVIAAFTALGFVQRLGWLTDAATDNTSGEDAGNAAATSYICPMMCTPPSPKPGRCPVCGMELVPATGHGGGGDGRSVLIDAAARRVAGIETVAVRSVAAHRTLEGIGRLDYDEGGRKTLAAYVDGRIEALFADYTGVKVAEDDTLAVLYSPKLYSAQVELLLARNASSQNSSGPVQRVAAVNESLARSARQRLVELGMTESQIAALEASGTADSRLQLVAPMRGTVIRKAVVEGQYVSEGDTIYELADLSSVWLMLELFPEDAALLRYGMRVQAEVQSLPGRVFDGRVTFVDPIVDPQTRTVGVRVVLANEDGALRIGDFARASIDVPLGDNGLIYDPELAGRWVSPRHPQITEDGPGACSICGVPLVPATELGFTDNPSLMPEALVVPRDAVLMAGSSSVVYIETEPGRFEIRQVVLGPVVDGDVVVVAGLASGDEVARRGNFLIDSQMQLLGNPSLIDPTRAVARAAPSTTTRPTATVEMGDLPPIGPMRLAEQDAVMPDVPPLPVGAMRLVEPVIPEDVGPPPPAAGTLRLAPVPSRPAADREVR